MHTRTWFGLLVSNLGDQSVILVFNPNYVEDTEGEADQASEGSGVVRRRKAFNADQSSTLADPKTLAGKAVDETFDTDPMFAKTSRLFDENSASGV